MRQAMPCTNSSPNPGTGIQLSDYNIPWDQASFTYNNGRMSAILINSVNM